MTLRRGDARARFDAAWPFRDPPAAVVWCLHCERFSEADDLRVVWDEAEGCDFVECAFDDCDGSALDVMPAAEAESFHPEGLN